MKIFDSKLSGTRNAVTALLLAIAGFLAILFLRLLISREQDFAAYLFDYLYIFPIMGIMLVFAQYRSGKDLSTVIYTVAGCGLVLSFLLMRIAGHHALSSNEAARRAHVFPLIMQLVANGIIIALMLYLTLKPARGK
ncbi:MAG: hypothetical protein V4543_00040 [Bacteroidota bacterium]